MKKQFLTICISAILCVLLFSALPVSADEYCYIVGNYESVKYEGDTYLPLDVDGVTVLDEGLEHLDVRFMEGENELTNHSCSVYQNEDAPFVLEVTIHGGRGSRERVFIRETRYEAVLSSLQGAPASYITHTAYGETVPFFYNVEDWADEEFIVENSLDYEYCDTHTLMEFYEGNLVRDYGMILRSTDAYGEDLYYLVRYSDYDTIADFYADGTLAMDKGIPLKLYPLKDKAAAQKLTALLDTTPKDELDWVVENDWSETVFFVFSLLLFGILPIVTLIITMVILLAKRPKRPFSVAWVVLGATAAVTVIAYSIILCIVA